MNVVILAGGLGTRLSEYTHEIPKPMVKIGKSPILLHVISIYVKYGLSNFYIAMGYKSEVILKYFLGNDFSKEFMNKEVVEIEDFIHDELNSKINIRLVNTGQNTMTGGRLKRLEKFFGKENFMLTYGDGVSNVNINLLRNFHEKHNLTATVTAVRPPSRFGELQIENDSVVNFTEKPQMQRGWINGGFFMFSNNIFKYINDDSTILEREPLEKISKKSELVAFRHDDFWQCMDTRRDLELLEGMYESNNTPWK